MGILERYIRNDTERTRAKRVEALAAGFAQRAAAHDREGSFPFDNFAELRDAGYLKLTVPREYGGEEISLYELVQLQERLAGGDGSTALGVGWHVGTILHLRSSRKWPENVFADLCKAVANEGVMINTFATEAGSGSPNRGGRPETTAVAADGGWRITGRKTFSTLSPILDRFVVSAYVPDEDATADFLVMRSDRVFVVETWDTLGMRGTGSHDVVLDGAWTELGHRLPAGRGVDDGGGWLLFIPACYIGIAVAARNYALDYARGYRPNHLSEPIAALPAVRQQFGEIEALLQSARSLLYATAERWDREPENRPAMKPELGLAKYIATNNAIRIVDLAMRIVGGASLSRSHPLERYYRDVRAGLHNPPMDSNVLNLLASAALEEREG